MFSPKFINSEHKDLIHDVAFDHYGRRMATCSSDQFVKVWDREQGDERWKKSAEWKAHSGSVWKVAWAHPEFGQVLATCSFDRTAAVWEEIVGESYNVIGQKHWARRTNLVDSRTSVTDVKFGPKSSGLVLATCSADGVIRIYEAPDVMNLAQWTLQQEVPCKYQASCVSWNPSYTGRNTSKDSEEADSVPPRTPVLAIGFDDQNCPLGNRVVVLQNLTGMRKWNRMDYSSQTPENPFNTVSDPVHDLAFAPRLGRSYDLLAVATKDVKLYTLCQVASKSSPKLRLSLAATLEDHSGTVWRISWNSVGSILASSGDDRCVRLWKQSPLVFKKDRDKDQNNQINKSDKNFIWQCVSTIKGDTDTYP